MSSDQSLINAVYYPSWRVYKGFAPSSLQLDCINQIYYAFIRLNEDGTLRPLDEFAERTKDVDGEKGCLNALAKLKQQKPKLRTLVSVGGGSGSAEFSVMAADSDCRATFASQCRQFVDKYEFDGVDLDWEHPETPEDGANYMALLRALRDTLPPSRYLLTTALPTGEYCLKNIDVEAAADLLDGLNLMGYDFNGPWTDVSGHHAQLLPLPGAPRHVYPALRNSCHRAVVYLADRGFPREKIILGVPVYARSFAGARGIGQPFRSAAETDYSELPDEWVSNASVDAEVGAASYVDSSLRGQGFVSFDVPDTVRQKAEYVKSNGLGGLFYWTGTGDRKGSESLVRAGYEAMSGSGSDELK
ncbi:glycoside hydrolase family 18 protein [Hypoxylon rubiginosum]|uniref:Glycoside hydrolase family 18 protein n=1 Tax=Hypoxylon rubiginosum TaxID=110542 RepID=A0ACB9ZB94_9PEZI|nr:glycoside hydrolase family 18 protein [Hypoxylon rubiginosum]